MSIDEAKLKQIEQVVKDRANEWVTNYINGIKRFPADYESIPDDFDFVSDFIEFVYGSL